MTSSKPGLGPRYIIILLFLAYAFSYVDRQILAILFEPIKAELALSDTQLGFLGGIAFALTYSLLGIPLALLADRRGRKGIITASLAIFSLMTVCCGMAGSFIQMAMARVGVGIGEAGINPASQSIISDLYPADQRSTPMSVVAMGAPVGMMMGLMGGGYVAGEYGWRVAFYIVGMPGVLLALLMWFTMKEPQRGKADAREQSMEAAPSFKETLGYMWRTKAIRYLLLGVTFTSIPGYGITSWFPSFFMRSFDISIGQAGLILGLGAGLVSAFGVMAGGIAYDRLAKVSHARGMRMLALVIVVAFPLSLALYFSESINVAIGFLIIPAFFSAFYLGPTNALMQSLAQVRMRAVASALTMLTVNLIGLGIGPQLIGIISDLLNPTYGSDSLRYALAIVASFSFIAAYFFLKTARFVEDDLQTVELAEAA